MIQLTILISVTILNFSLGLLVLAKNPRHWVNRSFALFAIGVAGWSIAQVSKLLESDQPLFWARWAFLMGGFVMFALVLFFHTFPFTNKLPRSRPFIALACCALLIAVFSIFSPWIVQSAVRTSRGRALTYGPLYPVFAAYAFSCIGYSVALIIRKARAARGAERQQLRYLFIALLVPGLLGISTNLVIPLLTRTSYLSQYGPLFSVLMIGMIAHAIIRYRFMNVRLVVRRGVVLIISIAVAGAFFAALIAGADRLTGGRADDAPLAIQVMVALLVAIAFQPLKHQIQSWLDHYVYRETYDYQRTIREATRTIASILDLKSLVGYLSDITSRTFRPDSVAIFTRNPRTHVFDLALRHSLTQDTAFNAGPLPTDSPLPAFLLKHCRHLLRNEPGQDTEGPGVNTASEHLATLGADLALPMLSENQLIGFLVLGPKLSGDAYLFEDVELLSTLSNQAAIAVRNAQLYQQVVLVNEYIENILSTMDSGVITVDADGHVALCNSTAERLTGVPKATLTSLKAEQLPTSIATPLRATLADGHSRSQIESTLTGDANRRIPIVCSTAALADDRGAIVGALVVFSDLSQVKALETEKRRAERLAAFSALVSGIAHEIKNPLVAIRTFAELLPDRFSEADFREDFARVVTTEIDRIDGLVGRLRGLAAPSLRQTTGVDIREPINETLALLRGQLEQTQTALHREFTDSEPLVAVDPSQLKQLFLNLFLNAIEAMGHGGTLTVRVRRRTSQDTQAVVVEVADSGPGIPESIRSSIFDPFFTTKPRGTGLGLAICRGIADAHRGTIRAEANQDQTGTTMVVEFPLPDTIEDPIHQSALLG